MRTDVKSLVTPHSQAAGDAFPVGDWRDLTVQITSDDGASFSATLQLEGSLDPIGAASPLWGTIGGPWTNSDRGKIVAISGAVKQVRANVTTYVSGLPLLKVSGHVDQNG